jgi:FtsH-binding integral membrane protein
MSFYSNSNAADARPIGIDLNAVMRQVYLWLAFGLIVAFGVAYVVGTSAMNDLTNALRTNTYPQSILFNPIVAIGSLIVYFILAFTLQPIIMRASTAVGALFYLLFTALFGFMLSSIFIEYTQSTIFLAFIGTAGMFGAMSIVGYTTKMDLSRMGGILMMALIGLIIASVVNFFLASTALDWLISYAGVLIFCGLTAYDTQWIRNYAGAMAQRGDPEMAARVGLIGAFHLFLDFVNLFMFILRIMGGGRRR